MSESTTVIEKKLTQEEIEQKIDEEILPIYEHPAFVDFDRCRPNEGQQFLIRSSALSIDQEDACYLFEVCPDYTAIKIRWCGLPPKWQCYAIPPVAAFEYDPERGYIEYERHDDKITDDFYEKITDDVSDLKPLKFHHTLDELLESLPKQFRSFNSKHDRARIPYRWEQLPKDIKTEKQFKEYLNTPNIRKHFDKMIKETTKNNEGIIKNHPNYREKLIQSEFEKMLGVAAGSLSSPKTADSSAGDTKAMVESKTNQDRPLDKDALPYMIRPGDFAKFMLRFPYLPGNPHGFNCRIVIEATYSPVAVGGAFKVTERHILSGLDHLHCYYTFEKYYLNLEDLIKEQMEVSREAFKKELYFRIANGDYDKDPKASKAEAQDDPMVIDSPPVIFSDLDGKSAGETAANIAADRNLREKPFTASR